MRNIREIFLLISAVLLIIPVQAQHTLRLMTHDIKNTTGMDSVCSSQRIANVINNASPDVVAVQEIDSVANRSSQKYVLGEVAERTQMYACFAPAINHNGGKYGISLLLKKAPVHLQTIALLGREEAHVLILTEFEDYIYYCIYLPLTEEDRTRSSEILKIFAASYKRPLFLVGDVNTEPESDLIKEPQKEFRIFSNPKRRAFPAPVPKEAINYVTAFKQNDKGFAIASSEVVDEPVAFDHHPIVVELRTTEKTNKMFRIKPYLQNPIRNGMAVTWEATIPICCWIGYGTDTTQLRHARIIIDGQIVCNNKLHKIRLDDLQPGQKYYCHVCSQEILLCQAYKKVFGNIVRSAFSELMLPVTGMDFLITVVFNDLYQHTRTFRALYRQIQDIDYGFVVFNGDCADDPASHDQAAIFISELTEGVRRDCIPTFSIRRGHEIRDAYSIGLRDHFDYVSDETYGSFNWGDVRIIMLDCGEDKTNDHWVYYDLNDFTQLHNEQVGFLKRELAAKEFKKTRKCILSHHIPLYGNDGKNLCAELWIELLERILFNIYLNAHTHKYTHHPKGELGNHFPVIIGGGCKMKGATVTILEKRKEELRVRVLDAKGETLPDITV